MNKKIAVLFALILVGMLFAIPIIPPPVKPPVKPVQPVSSSGLGSVSKMLASFCKDAKNIMLIATMLMIILAAVTYALGQMMGAETRARATVWATAMLTGAIFAMLIYVLAPWGLSIMANSAVSC